MLGLGSFSIFAKQTLFFHKEQDGQIGRVRGDGAGAGAEENVMDGWIESEQKEVERRIRRRCAAKR